VCLKDGNFHCDLEKQKKRKKKTEQTILARKDQSNRVRIDDNRIFKVKMQQNNCISQNQASPATACLHTMRHVQMRRGFQGNLSIETWNLLLTIHEECHEPTNGIGSMHETSNTLGMSLQCHNESSWFFI
jgi:hypothetical protein